MHLEVVHVPVAPIGHCKKPALTICCWIHEFLSLQEGLPFSGDQMDFGPAHFRCPAHPSLFLLYAPSLALPSHLCVLPSTGALCCHCCHFGFPAVPPSRRSCLAQGWCLFCYEIVCWLWLQQAAGRSCLPSSSFSELLHCWISEQWGWGLLCSCIAAVAVLPAPWLDPNFSGSYLHLNCSS